ncbi:hypothetical protein HPCPY1313_0255 [Helicobacter pylori CPY1313]|nr:hypothetical protein HPCPY1313_0255 [Helicobacter pylori CPY1313]
MVEFSFNFFKNHLIKRDFLGRYFARIRWFFGVLLRFINQILLRILCGIGGG